MTYVAEWLIYALVGGASGLLAGLFGIGGGVVITPLLVILFEFKGFGEQSAHLAVATSLAVVVSNSLSAAYNQYKRSCVDMRAHILVPALGIGALIGTYFAGWISGYLLRIILVCFLVFMAGYMLVINNDKQVQANMPRWLSNIFALAIGFFSAIVGIAGGTFLVPLFSAMGRPIRVAVGTSSALGVPLTFIATLGYIVLGMGVPERPPLSLGYIYIPAFIGLVLIAPFGAKVGVAVGHSISPKKLRLVFSCFLLLSALEIIWNLVSNYAG